MKFVACRVVLIISIVMLFVPLLRAEEAFPKPTHVGDLATLGLNIQRAMTLLATSTPQQRNTVRVLFYGQSITVRASGRWRIL